MFTQKDINQIEERGTTVREVSRQIDCFRSGFPWMKIVGPATPERGIRVLAPEAVKTAIDYYKGASVHGKCKFVPASGAASRMFKDMFSGLSVMEEGKDLPADAPGARLAARIKDFAFYTPELFGEPADTPEYRLKALRLLLKEEGLAYGSKPKGVLKFHRYPTEVRTAIAEMNPGNLPTFVLGYLGVSDGKTPYSRIIAKYNDCYTKAPVVSAEYGTVNNFDLAANHSSDRYDFVFASRNVSVLAYGQLQYSYFTQESDGTNKRRLPSTHFPVMAKVKLP